MMNFLRDARFLLVVLQLLLRYSSTIGYHLVKNRALDQKFSE